MKELVKETLYRNIEEKPLIDEILSIGRLKKAKTDQIIIDPDNQGNEMPLVISGSLKVMRQEPNGKEVFLYFLEGGETCAMSITCCLEKKKTTFKLVAEEESILWMIPINFMDDWVVKYRSFRKYVFSSYQERFDELLNTIDSIVFLNMHERLYKYLLDKKQVSGSHIINKTHQQIADELNTSRVVVSRLLKQLEREEKIEQNRNKIQLL